MERTLAFGVAPALLLVGLASVANQDAPAQDAAAQSGAREEEEQALKRVPPVPVEEEEREDPYERIFAKDLSREQWIEWLTTPDLDAREEHFEDLLRRARIDPRTRAFVEELARDENRPDAAWTARLALRELGRADFPLFGFAPDGLPDQRRELEEMMAELWGRHGAVDPFVRPPHRLRVPPRLTLPPGSSSGKTMRIEQGPDGAKIVVTETVDGKEQVREYTGESLEQILSENPELEGSLHVELHWQGREGHGFFDPFQYGDRRVPPRDWLRERDDLDRLFSPTQPSRPMRTDLLGVLVVPVDEELADELGLEDGSGLLVRQVLRRTIAHLLGVEDEDVLVELNGKRLASAQDITDVMTARDPEDPIELVWFDDLGQRHAETWTPAGKDR